MGAIPDTKWNTPDDILLKNSVEAGATLESLSKGAVRFSKRYTVQELQDRWHSLLYDPIVSAETSALMFEHERSSLRAQSKSCKTDGTKHTRSLLRKRKGESIRTRYYAMRKMASNVSQAVDTLDMNFLAGPGLTNYENLDEPTFADFLLPDSCHHRCPDSTFDVTTHACPDTFCGALPATVNDVPRAPSFFVSGGLTLVSGDLGHNTLLHLDENVLPTRDHCMTENYGQVNELPVPDLHKSEGLELNQPAILNQVTDSEVPITDCPALHNLGYKTPLSPATDWHAMGGISTPILPDVDYDGNEDHINDTFRSSHDVDNHDTLGPSAMQKNANLNEQTPYLGSETETASIIAQLNQFLDCTDDLPDTVDDFYIDTFCNLLVDYPNEPEGALACPSVTSIATEGYPDLASGKMVGESIDSNSNHCSIDRGIVCSSEGKEKLLSSALSVNPAFPELRNGLGCCRLNTEDQIVPDNDDVFLPVCMPTLSLSCFADWEFDKARNPVSSSIMDIPTHQRAKRGGLLMMKKNKQSDSDNPLLSSHRLSSSFPTHQKVKNEWALVRKKEQLDKTTHGGDPMTEREQIDSDRAKIIISSVPTPQNITNRAMLMVKGEETDNNQTHIMSSSLQLVVNSNHAANVHDGNIKLKHIDPQSGMLRTENENTHIDQLKFTNENEKDTGSHHNNHPVGYAHENEVNIHNRLSSVVDAKLQNKNSAVLHSGVFSHEEFATTEVVAPELEKDLELFSNEECPDDDDVPYSSDVEAMILGMDFSPNDEDSDQTVWRHPNENVIRTMLRLEQAACASSHRMMQAYGAFAVLFSNHTRHLIKKPEVLLGRAAEDDQVDIDLSFERCRNQVSRQQATIKVNNDGAFTLKNFGKTSIYVNGREVSTGQSQYLTSSCLIEIRRAAFLFETNPARVKQYIEEEIGGVRKMPNIEEEICRANKRPKQEPLALE
ncbi:hypothetical protein Leryth_003621 [Lithospermum erythrorhizon]|nr:hypothetical protein Leryth_003621 [Lithospermum erythrorhizon]